MIDFKTKKNRIWLFCLMIMLLVCVATLVGNSSLKDVTSSEATLEQVTVLSISSPEELMDFASRVNGGESFVGKRVVLSEDIDLDGVSFVPIGIYGSEQLFRGVFDGQGHVIRNMTVTCTQGEGNNGLFGVLAGEVCNLGIEDATLAGNVCGVFCSVSDNFDAKIYNCYGKRLHIQAAYTDGLFGQYLGYSKNCILLEEAPPDYIDFGEEIKSEINNYNSGELCFLVETALNNRDNRVEKEWKLYQSGQETEKMLNSVLLNCSNNMLGLPMMNWKLQDGSLCFSEETTQIEEIYLQTNTGDALNNLQAMYSIEDNTYYFIVPENLQTKAYSICYQDKEGKDCAVRVSMGETTASGINAGEEYVLPEIDCTVRMLALKNTPAIFIETKEPWGQSILEDAKENELSGKMMAYDEEGRENYNGGLEAIHTRGNDSWLKSSKKGISIKLKEESPLFSLGSAKNYCLLSGARDDSLMSYLVSDTLNSMVDYAYTPDFALVNVYLDKKYMGAYILSEKVEAGPYGVPVSKGKGVLLEIDNEDFEEQPQYITLESDNHIIVKNPVQMSMQEKDALQAHLQEAEDGIYALDGINAVGRSYAEYMDVKSFARQWLSFEINCEYSLYGSIYFYQGADGRMVAVPPWDVEHSFMKREYADRAFIPSYTTEHEINRGLYMAMAQHEDFQKELRQCWQNEFSDAIQKLPFDEWKERYASTSKANCLRWGGKGFDEKLNDISDWMDIRYTYLEKTYGQEN